MYLRIKVKIEEIGVINQWMRMKRQVYAVEYS
jgi:hypothetical protein